MAELANAYAESTGRSTSTSTTVGGANKVRLTHTPASDERWLYLWNCVLDYNDTAADATMRLRNETASVDWANCNVEMQDLTNRVSVGGLKVHTYGASPGSQDLDLDFWCEAASDTVGCSDAHIFGLKLETDDKYAEDDSQQDDTTGAATFVTALTLNETLNGDYLFLCSAEISGHTVVPMQIRADKDGTKYGSLQWTAQDATTWRTWATGFKLTGLTGSQTVTIEFCVNTGGNTVSVRKCRILALKLSRFNKHGYQEDRTRDTNASSTPEDQSSLTFLPDAARNHIAIAGMILDHNVNTTNGFGEFERDGTAINQCQEEPQTAGDGFSFFSLRRESLTTGDKVYKTQKWSETTNTTGAAESWIIVLDLEEGVSSYEVSITETATLGDTPSSEGNFQVSAAESVTMTDDLAVFATFLRDLTETVTLSDALDGFRAFDVSLTETIIPADTIDVFRTLPVDFVQSVTISDAYISELIAQCALIETVTPEDSFVGSLNIPVALTETVTLTEAVIVGLTLPLSVSEAMTLADALVANLIAEVAVTESFTLSDGSDQTSGEDLITEVITLSDHLVAELVAQVVVSESVTLSDSLVAEANFQATLAEAITPAMQLAVYTVMQASVEETATLDDALSAAANYQVSVVFDVTLTDGLTQDDIEVIETVTLSVTFDNVLITAALMDVTGLSYESTAKSIAYGSEIKGITYPTLSRTQSATGTREWRADSTARQWRKE